MQAVCSPVLVVMEWELTLRGVLEATALDGIEQRLLQEHVLEAG
jgi:hypothetical protein